MNIFAAVLFGLLALMFGALLDAHDVHTAYIWFWGVFTGMILVTLATWRAP